MATAYTVSLGRWRAMEACLIAQVLADLGSIREASKVLGIPRATLGARIRRMKSAGLWPEIEAPTRIRREVGSRTAEPKPAERPPDADIIREAKSMSDSFVEGMAAFHMDLVPDPPERGRRPACWWRVIEVALAAAIAGISVRSMRSHYPATGFPDRRTVTRVIACAGMEPLLVAGYFDSIEMVEMECKEHLGRAIVVGRYPGDTVDKLTSIVESSRLSVRAKTTQARRSKVLLAATAHNVKVWMKFTGEFDWELPDIVVPKMADDARWPSGDEPLPAYLEL